MRHVLKFGGTSVGSLTAFENIKIILSRSNNINFKKLVVLSAASKSTNYLINIYESLISDDIEMAKRKFLEYKNHEEKLNDTLNINNSHFLPFFEELGTLLYDYYHGLYDVPVNLDKLSADTPVNLDKLRDHTISFGERISIYRLHLYLKLFDIKSYVKPSWELGFITDSNYGESTLLDSSYENIKQTINNINDDIIITSGFIGKDNYGNITTLGRGGSDLSASLFASAIISPEVQIWSDVPGVMTCDPRIIQKSKLIKEMTYDEALELSFHGAKILHPKTVEPLLGKKIDMRVLNTFDIESTGTLIREASFDKDGPTGISFSKNNLILQITPKKQLMSNKLISSLFQILNNDHSNLVSISKTTMSIAMTSVSQELLEKLTKDFSIEINKHISVVCLVGENMHNKLGIASKFFQTITDCNVNIEMISQSSIQSNILVAVQDEYLDVLLKRLHSVFFE